MSIGGGGICAQIMNGQPISNVIKAAFGEVAVNANPAFFTISSNGFLNTIKATVLEENTVQQCDGGYVVLKNVEPMGLVGSGGQLAFAVPDIACITTYSA
ncbi:MAG: hypothetical protein RLZ12_438 [Bacillota bacterium]|jgi:hypothetical protein